MNSPIGEETGNINGSTCSDSGAITQLCAPTYGFFRTNQDTMWYGPHGKDLSQRGHSSERESRPPHIQLNLKQLIQTGVER